MPKISEEQREARREHILAAARRCFMRKGFHETSMLDLFAEAGLSSGSVYLYFKSKDDVIMAIAEENMREVVTVIHALASSDRGSGESLGAALADVIRVVEKKNQESALGPLTVIVWSEAIRNPELRQRFEVAVSGMREDLTEVVRGYQADGKLPTAASAEALAALFISIVPGVILQLALFGQQRMAGVADAAEALWPQ